MSCLSWNCRGLGNPRTVRALHDLIKDHNPSFLFLIETISYSNKIEDIRVRFGFEHCFVVDRVGRSGGLAVLWKHPIQCEISGYSQHHIDVLFSENNVAAWRLSCFYGYPERTRRRESWNLLRNLASLSSIPRCIWGDFNDLMYSTDKKGKTPHPQYLLDGFRTTMDDCQLSELNLEGGRFTWEKCRGTTNWVREKLDRGFASLSWWQKFPIYSLKVLHTSVSDHEPLLLNFLNVHISKKVFRFRFENMWLKEPNFIQEVSHIWAALPISHLLPKLIEVSSFMARWGRTFFHKFRDKVKEHKERLDRLVDCVDARSVQAYLDEKEKLNVLLLKEEIYWKQRAKLFWLAEGDENTRFFHASASARKKANKISYLINNEGEKVENHEDMCEIVRNYFNTLFTGDGDVTRMSNLTSPRKVSAAQNMKLTEEFSFTEFSTAIKQMHPDKASGPDGLNPAFFQTFWAMMGREVFEYCRIWLRDKQLPGELNCTNVVLIPKKGERRLHEGSQANSPL